MAHPTSRKERLMSGYTGKMFILLTSGSFVILLGRRLLPPLLPVIIDDLVITSVGAGIALSAMDVTRASAHYPGGRFSDQLTRKTILLISIGLAILGFGLLSLTQTYLQFFISIVVLGAAVGLFVPVDRALISDLFHEKRGRAFGFHFTANDITGIVAAGGAVAVVAVAPWQTAFLFAIPALVLVAVTLYWWGKEPIEIAHVDLAVRETARRLFGTAHFRSVVTAYALRSFTTQGITTFLPTFLIVVHGFSFSFASGAFALRFVVGLVIKPVTGILADRISRPLIALGALLVTGAGITLLIMAPSVPLILSGVIVYATGQKAFGTPMQAYLMDSFPNSSMGGDFGATRTTYRGIGSLGPAFVGFVAGMWSYPIAYGSMIVFLLIAALLILWVERQ